VGDDARLRRQVEQQRLALAQLSDALVGLQRGTKALREENRELRRELEVARCARRVPPGAGGQSHADRIEEILRGASS